MKRLIVLIVAASAALMLISCDRYDDGRPEKNVRSEFSKMYPDAFDVEWEWERTYWEVSFEMGTRPDGTEYEAWYDADGNWLRTKKEVLLSAVPQEVKSALAADPEYGTAPFADDDAEYVETPSGSFYCFDLYVNGVVVEVNVNLNGEVTFAKYDF